MGRPPVPSSPQTSMTHCLPFLAAFITLGLSAPENLASKEILTNSLVALKLKPADEKAVDVDEPTDGEVKTARQKRSGVMPFSQFGHLNIDHNDADQVTSAAAVLAKYIKDTGDQEGVVEFLQFMVKSGKLSPKEVIVYVNKVMENLKQAEDSHNHHEVDDLQKERHATQAENERKQLEDLHTNKLNQLEMEKKSLTQTKEEIEKKILALQTQKSKEEDEFKKKQKLSILAKEVEEGEKDNETILKINDFLEEQKKLSKISKNLYMHVKEALIETTVDNLSKITADTSA